MVPSAVSTKRKTNILWRRAPLGLRNPQYDSAVATKYSSAEKILFDVQWWPEKFFSQSFNGTDNSAQIVIMTTKIIVTIAAYADEIINFGLFIRYVSWLLPNGPRQKS